MRTITVTVNGKEQTVGVRDAELLIETLRERLGLLGTRHSCLEGDCGVCTVLFNGQNVLSCLMLSVDADGAEITTIEGMAQAGALHPLQEAFIEKGAVQCGFCTPGMVLAAKALLDETPHPSEAEIARALDGNLCRCTGYIRIIEAVRDAANKTDDRS